MSIIYQHSSFVCLAGLIGPPSCSLLRLPSVGIPDAKLPSSLFSIFTFNTSFSALCFHNRVFSFLVFTLLYLSFSSYFPLFIKVFLAFPPSRRPAFILFYSSSLFLFSQFLLHLSLSFCSLWSSWKTSRGEIRKHWLSPALHGQTIGYHQSCMDKELVFTSPAC